MSESAPAEYDRRKIRIGLAIISVVVIAALVLLAVVESTVGKGIMFAIAVLGFGRLFLLSRDLRRGS